MKLSDFERFGSARSARLVKLVADVAGAEDYELSVAGPASVIKKVLSKSDFSVVIDPARSADQAGKELQEDSRLRLEEFSSAAKLDNIAKLPVFKKTPGPPTKDRTVFVSLRRVRGAGTFWGPWRFSFFLPRGFNIIVLPPPLCSLSASVTPTSGDQDIFLSRLFASAPFLSSIGGGTAVDTLNFLSVPCNVASWNFLMIRIFGFATGIGTFTMRGLS